MSETELFLPPVRYASMQDLYGKHKKARLEERSIKEDAKESHILSMLEFMMLRCPLKDAKFEVSKKLPICVAVGVLEISNLKTLLFCPKKVRAVTLKQNEIICSFFAQTSHLCPQSDDEGPAAIDEDAMEEIDIRWQWL
ncbi:hypothetical protein Tco_0956368 [Tanacetum coccineum]